MFHCCCHLYNCRDHAVGRTSDHKDDGDEGPDNDDDGAHVAVTLSSITRQPSISSSAISSSSGASPGIYANVVTSVSPWQSTVRYYFICNDSFMIIY